MDLKCQYEGCEEGRTYIISGPGLAEFVEKKKKLGYLCGEHGFQCPGCTGYISKDKFEGLKYLDSDIVRMDWCEHPVWFHNYDCLFLLGEYIEGVKGRIEWLRSVGIDKK